MTKQPEAVLEHNLVQRLIGLGHEPIHVKTEADLLRNLKIQLEKHNNTTFSDTEFNAIVLYLSKGNIFHKAATLRDRYKLKRDDDTTKYIEFINQDFWCQNQFQVTNQVTIHGKRENRYDVTLLINGLPLVQIELKKRGVEMKEAYNQVWRYQEESYSSNHALFNYVQIFIVSNGVNTKYFANNISQDYKHTSFWGKENNAKITQLDRFADIFLEPCHIAKMITKYVVINQANKNLMVLRPYQYYAVEAIIDRVKNSDRNGYIWHTTGSGKTLTSFKASQILTNNPSIKKVVFVVDRQDLDDQTVREFKAFDKDSIDGTDNTNMLIQQFLDDDRPLIVTTIQKLNNAITKARFRKRIEAFKDEKIVFIFDECHRSQFGKTHRAIVHFFTNHQLFGFTGTPIFEKNAISKDSIKQTTANLFDDCLHRYVITDAIRDENVLKFSIEYYNVFKAKEHIDDIQVEDINKQEVYESDAYIEAITNYIIAHHDRKTYHRKFTAIFCVSSVDILIKYYELFKAKRADGDHDLTIATIFSYNVNEPSKQKEAIGTIEEEDLRQVAESELTYKSKRTRDKLDEFIVDYNKRFKTNHSAKDGNTFLAYKKDISKRVRKREIDILLVVNMFLTGFDSKPLNTLYVDKNLKYHGLIQAYSRTNRIYNNKKSQGNILVFRNLKEETDAAVALFSDKHAKETIEIAPYETQVKSFNEAYKNLMAIAPTVDSVNDLVTEEEEAEFVKAFREISRLKNVLSSFIEFTFDDIYMDEQAFEDYKGKYLYLYDKARRNNAKESVSILNEIDFELELICRDEINVTYIMRLLAKLKNAKPKEKATQRKHIMDLLSGEATLRSKRELIEKFINQNLPQLSDDEDIETAFKAYWDIETKKALKTLNASETLSNEKVEYIINDYLFTGRMATEDELIDAMEQQPSVLQRETIGNRIKTKILDFIETFMSGIG